VVSFTVYPIYLREKNPISTGTRPGMPEELNSVEKK
jgi:hypothetical protein